MSRGPPVLYECKDGVGLITINRPERMNGWTGELGEAWYDAYDRAAADNSCRVIVVVGSGRAWCAGADMGMLQATSRAATKSVPGADTAKDPAKDPAKTGIVVDSKGRGYDYAHKIPKPIIACINGAVGGGGLAQAMMCDMRFAAEGVNFSSAFARRGLIAEWGISWSMPNCIGTGAAMDVLLSARKFTAQEALQLGVVQRVFPREELLEATLAYARDLAQNVPPISMAIIKQQLYRHPHMELPDALREANRLMVTSLKHPDFKEGVASYVEKRPPSFQPYNEKHELVAMMREMQKSKL